MFTDRVRELANDQRFVDSYKAGETYASMTKRFAASSSTIRSAAQCAGLESRSERDDEKAPTPEDAEASLAGLALAPAVFAAAEQFRERHERRRQEQTDEALYHKRWRLENRRPRGRQSQQR